MDICRYRNPCWILQDYLSRGGMRHILSQSVSAYKRFVVTRNHLCGITRLERMTLLICCTGGKKWGHLYLRYSL